MTDKCPRCGKHTDDPEHTCLPLALSDGWRKEYLQVVKDRDEQYLRFDAEAQRLHKHIATLELALKGYRKREKVLAAGLVEASSRLGAWDSWSRQYAEKELELEARLGVALDDLAEQAKREALRVEVARLEILCSACGVGNVAYFAPGDPCSCCGAPVSDWEPIATVPKDGTPVVLAYLCHWPRGAAYYAYDEFAWDAERARFCSGERWVENATFWMRPPNYKVSV